MPLLPSLHDVLSLSLISPLLSQHGLVHWCVPQALERQGCVSFPQGHSGEARARGQPHRGAETLTCLALHRFLHRPCPFFLQSFASFDALVLIAAAVFMSFLSFLAPCAPTPFFHYCVLAKAAFHHHHTFFFAYLCRFLFPLPLTFLLLSFKLIHLSVNAPRFRFGFISGFSFDFCIVLIHPINRLKFQTLPRIMRRDCLSLCHSFT